MTFKDRIIAKDPYCVFCGGQNLSETVDHVPHRGMFSRRLRPKGLEFGACRPCNDGARKVEQLAQLVSLFQESPQPGFEAAVRTAFRNFPALADELYERTDASLRQRKIARRLVSNGVIVNARGPVLNSAMVDFAAKLGLALHREVTGKIVPPEGFIACSWYTDIDVATGYAEPPLQEYLSQSRELRAGTWSTSDEFRYASVWTPNAIGSMHRAVFRDVFAVDAIVAADPSHFLLLLPHAPNLRQPGFLRRAEI